MKPVKVDMNFFIMNQGKKTYKDVINAYLYYLQGGYDNDGKNDN